MTNTVIELTWSQIYNRLKLLSHDYNTYKLMQNTKRRYNPQQVKQICKFRLNNDIIYAYTPTKLFEVYDNKLCNMLEDLKTTIDSMQSDSKALVLGDNNGVSSISSSICGIYIDDKNKYIVLLNGFHMKKEIDWTEYKSNII